MSSCPCYSPDAMKPCPFVENLYKLMAYYGFNAIQYCNTYAIGTHLPDMPDGKRWRVGVWSGTHRNIMALKFCETDDEALVWESPLGWDISDAVEAAIIKLTSMRPY